MTNSQIVLRAFNKQAGGFGDTISGLGEKALGYYNGLDPTVQAAILGTGAGGVLGGLGNAAFGSRRHGLLRRLLTGGVIGGGLGGLGAAGANELSILNQMNKIKGSSGKMHADRGDIVATKADGTRTNRLLSDEANDLILGPANRWKDRLNSKPNLGALSPHDPLAREYFSEDKGD